MPLKKIRFRARRGYVREHGGHCCWNEYQVCEGRRVIDRYDFLDQALRDYPDAVPDESAAPPVKPRKRS